MADTFTPEGTPIGDYLALHDKARDDASRMSHGLFESALALGVIHLQELLKLADEMERLGTPVDDVTLHFKEPACTAIRRARTEGWF